MPWPKSLIGDEGHEDQGFVQDVVLLDVVQEHRRDAVRDLGQPYGDAGRPHHHHLVDVRDEACERHRHGLQAMANEGGALAPTEHQAHDGAADGDRKPAAFDDLQQVGSEKGRVHRAEDDDDEDRDRGRPSPAPDGHAIEQDGRDQHGAGHGDAVGAGQVLGCLEQNDDQQGADHQ